MSHLTSYFHSNKISKAHSLKLISNGQCETIVIPLQHGEQNQRKKYFNVAKVCFETIESICKKTKKYFTLIN